MKTHLVIFGKIAAAVLVAVLVSHVLTRFFVFAYPLNAQNLILSKYTLSRSGIYLYDPAWKTYFMKPDFEARMFYNGFQWDHRTNALGIRDDENFDRADVVLLGDSMIYGHGLEFRDTIGERLESRTGFRVANLGQQGDYPVNEYIRLKFLGLSLRPRTVVWFINGGQDERDFAGYNPSKQYVEDLIAALVPGDSVPPSAVSKTAHERFFVRDLAERHALWRLVTGVFRARAEMSRQKRNSTLLNMKEFEDQLRSVIGALLLDAKRLCDHRGARLVIAFNNSQPTRVMGVVVREFAQREGIPVIELKWLGKDYHLRGDGHYSPKGADAVAGKFFEAISG